MMPEIFEIVESSRIII